MKRFFSILTLFLTLITCARAQVITITFEGTLNSAPTPLDSILVMNLTAGGDTTIYFPDNMLILDGATGLAETAAKAPVLRNQPNPFAGATDILVSTRNSGQALLTVHDATGREVAAYASSLAAGQHRFRFTAAAPGVHLITVVQNGERTTHRLIALTGEGNAAGFTYSGIRSTGGTAKSDRSLFTWTSGNELRYIGYSTAAGIAHSAAIDDVPVASATHTFELFAGLACLGSPTVVDIDGNVYHSVLIGGQCWMTENLRTTHYNDGVMIPNVPDHSEWFQLNDGAWCNYGNNSNLDGTFGKIYNGYAALNPNICPQGWHVPTDGEWQQLEAFLGMPVADLDQVGTRGDPQNIGVKMRSTTGWPSNPTSSNACGFSALPSGMRDINFNWQHLNGLGSWWSVSESSVWTAWYRHIANASNGIFRSTYSKRQGLCVRCVRD